MWIEYQGELYNLDKVIRARIASFERSDGQIKYGVGLDFGDYYSELGSMTKENAEAVISEICINLNRDEPYGCLQIENALEQRRRQKEYEAGLAAAAAECMREG